jgi:tyrosyl-tRNA synthetase
LFGRGDLGGLDERVLADALAELPLARLPRGEHPLADLFAATGLVASKSAARRAVAEGGAYVNNLRIDDADAVAGPGDLLHGRWLLLRRGRRSLAAVELVDGHHGE